jgi:hypothetical protein
MGPWNPLSIGGDEGMSEVGKCYKNIQHDVWGHQEDGDSWYWKVLAEMKDGYYYCEELRIHKGRWLGIHYEEGENRWNVGIEQEPKELHRYDRKEIPESLYNEKRNYVLKMLGVQAPDNPILKNFIAVQYVAEAERLIKKAIELELILSKPAPPESQREEKS